MQHHIVMQIPKQALELMERKSPATVYQELITNGRLTLMELLTFGMYNTSIYATPAHEELIAYVTYWEGQHVTCVAVDGDECRLLGVEASGNLDTDAALVFFRKYWNEETK